MPAITLLVHNIRSTHNIGSIFRTAEGFGIREIIFSGYSPYPKLQGDTRLPHIADKLTTQIHKTALGAEKLVPFSYYEQLDTWLHQNQAGANLPVIALEQAPNSINIRDYTVPDRFALLLGEEVDGINAHYLPYCLDIIEIPMMGQKESYNVSVATGIALYALTS